ncbi:MAG: response regulator transcription factor [Clostridiales bacterium]|jgi:DNA-binding response OmpR family regulator|nr:response regulator transcription factor [Clostridiales bacterium]
MRVLIVDDERTLAEMLTEILKREKIEADAVFDGADAVEYALTGRYDLIVLDIMLPKISGLDVLKILREKKLSAPVLFLSAKSEVSDKIAGLNIGADDYLTKPFAAGEFVARVKALSRRKAEYVGNVVIYGSLRLNKDTFALSSGENEIRLSATEFKIIDLLMSNPEAVVLKERLIERVWGWDSEAEYNNAEVYISFLRKKLAAVGSDVRIKSVSGAGYLLQSGTKGEKL